MNQWANTVLTDKGAGLLAKLAQGNTLNITRAATGGGFVTPGMLTKQTEITGHKQDLAFKAVTYPENGKCAIPVSLKNDALEAGYEVTQVGLYATDPDEGEILLIISQAPDADSGTIVPSATEMPGYSAEWTFYLQYGQADGVTVMVSPSNTVTVEDMENYVNNVLKKAATQAYVSEQVNAHNAADNAHNDIRVELKALSDRINAALDSDDTTLDELSEIVAYIKSNKTLIDAITTSKVSVSDIINNLTTNVANKPLSAAQGVALKTLIDALQTAVDGKAPASHNQAASTITAGTLAGQVKANATAAATVGTAQVRDISAGTEDMTPGSSPLPTGSLYFVYE